jgi:D-amino-acid dehydrogenase
MEKQVTIIGGGIIGLACAWYLLKDGYQVTIVDRGDLTSGTSFGNAGYISPSHFTPLATPEILLKASKWMFSPSSPFYIQPRMSLDLLRWGLAFRKSATSSVVQQNILPLCHLLMFSRELTVELSKELNNSFGLEEKGCLMLYQQTSTEKHELELARKAQTLGMQIAVLNAAGVQDLEPDTEVNVKGGILFQNDCHLHPGRLMTVLKEQIAMRGGTIYLNTEVNGFFTNGKTVTAISTTKGNIPCHELVIAAGAWLPLLTKKLGIELLLEAGKGYSMTYSNITKNLHYPAILLEKRVAMTPLGRDLRIGGTMEITGLNQRLRIIRAKAIFKGAKGFYPGLNIEFPDSENIWQGLRPLSPDGLPYIGRVKAYDNLTLAGGHAMLGVSLAAATGKLVQELISFEKPSLELDAFRVERF